MIILLCRHIQTNETDRACERIDDKDSVEISIRFKPSSLQFMHIMLSSKKLLNSVAMSCKL